MLSEQFELLGFAERLVSEAATVLRGFDRRQAQQVVSRKLGSRETKFAADAMLETFIAERLAVTGLSVLSEESSPPDAAELRDLFWVVDPLDGSVNYARGSGPYATSVALWRGDRPVFGVIARGDDGTVLSGGAAFPSRTGPAVLRVSRTALCERATIATGLPARFSLDDARQRQGLIGDIADFAKVRMIGSAAVSLCLVASGAVDYYTERGIMLWDVAAGLAIVEGAGGLVRWSGDLLGPLRVEAGNGLISLAPGEASYR